MSDTELVKRIEKLERDKRRFKSFALVVLVLATALTAIPMGASNQPQSSGTPPTPFDPLISEIQKEISDLQSRWQTTPIGTYSELMKALQSDLARALYGKAEYEGRLQNLKPEEAIATLPNGKSIPVLYYPSRGDNPPRAETYSGSPIDLSRVQVFPKGWKSSTPQTNFPHGFEPWIVEIIGTPPQPPGSPQAVEWGKKYLHWKRQEAAAEAAAK